MPADTEIFPFCPSPQVVWPPEISPLNPEKFLSVIKLTTPATASDPQEAEAPPVTTSTLWIRPCGNSLTSVPPVVSTPTTLWPSISTRVRLVPRLRNDKVERPSVPALLLVVPVEGWALPAISGIWLMTVNTLSSEAF